VEAVTLINIGSALGLLAAPSLLHVGLRLLPVNIPLLKMPAIDWRVAGFVALSALALTVPTTIWPIRRALRASSVSLGDGARSSERHRSIGHQLVVALQIAGALVLTVTGGLLVSSLLVVYAHEPGIHTDGVVSIRVNVQGPGDRMWMSPERTVRVGALVTGMHTIPGVAAVAVTSGQILRGTGWTQWFHPPNDRPDASQVAVDVSVMAVTSEFYQVLRPVVVAGRLPTREELVSDAHLVVISESLARAFWRGTTAVGRTLTYKEDPGPFAVVGVVQDARLWRLDDDTAAIYGPYARFSRSPGLGVLIRATDHVGEVVNNAPGVVERIDPLMKASGAMTMDDALAGSIQPRRLQSWLFGSFAASALVIVCVGVFGLTAMAIARRTREVGIRMALGSTRPRVVTLLLREQFAAVSVGLIVGAVGAAWIGQFLRWYLYKLSAYDPRVWMLATIAIISVAAIGTLVPGLRASRVDPVQALRVE
jgi:predicted permease